MLTLAKLASLYALVASLSLVTAAAKHGSPRRRHPGTTYLQSNETHEMSKRGDNARMTFYEAGLGACGKVNNDGDFIVALNSAQFGSGSHCFETITISYQGKTAQAQIADECPGCPPQGLDLTPGLFSHFASTDAGVIYGSWSFGAGAPEPKPEPEPTPTPKPKPSPTPEPKPTPSPTPTPTSEEKKTTSSSATPSSSSSSSSSSSATPSSSSEPTSSVVATPSTAAESESATPSPSVAAIPGGIDGFKAAFIQMIMLASSGSKAA